MFLKKSLPISYLVLNIFEVMWLDRHFDVKIHNLKICHSVQKSCPLDLEITEIAY